MNNSTKEELQEIINLHLAWLQDLDNGKRADLSGADLRYADLSGANLRYANLIGANLSGANLSGADHELYNFIAYYGIGSAKRQTLYIPEMDKVWCGCFKGTMAEFEAQVNNTYPNELHREAYLAGIEFLKKTGEIYRKDK